CGIFFFSSRRRHTRFDCDWSSDVCSSDLESQPAEQRDALLRARLDRLAEIEAMRRDADWPLEPAQAHRIDLILQYVAAEDDLIRSEERRVGKECRYRRSR